MEIMVYTGMDGLQPAIDGLTDVATIAPSKVEQSLRYLVGDHPPDVLYIDDTRGGPVTDMWKLITTAQQRDVRVLANMVDHGQALVTDLRNLGLEPISEREPTAIVAWVAQQLGVALDATKRGNVPIVAVGAAKGGIGKTFLTCLLAEGLRRRGMRVLVWDSDISNPGMVAAFRIPASAPSYLHLVKRGTAHWNPTGITPFIFQPEHTRAHDGMGQIDFLVGSHTVANPENDIALLDWQGLYRGVAQLTAYDIILIDTPPDYLRRPYATSTLMTDGYVILPCPPGARERMGVGHLLEHFRGAAPDRLDRSFLVFVEPERGVTVTVKNILPMFGGRYPEVRVLGTIPRAPRLASLADEHDGYISTFDLGPNTVFSQAAHRIVDSLMTQIGLTATCPMPKLSAWVAFQSRLRGEKINVPAANTSVGALARELATQESAS